MKIERTRNASRNIVFGGLLKLYQIIIPFILRSLMIYCMGIQYVGLGSLFNSILQVLNLAELGVGAAMVYSMYKPIAENDNERICILLVLYRKYYRIIGIIVFALGIILLPFLRYLIKKDIPDDINIYLLYLVNLLAVVFSYWLFAYKNSLLQAHQRNDVISKITFVTNTIQYIFQIIAIILLKNYYCYVLPFLFLQIANNLITNRIVKKMYPDYTPVGTPSDEVVADINNRIRDLFTSKVGAVMTYSVDTIVISACLGLSSLAIYQNYSYIFNSVTAVLAILFSSLLAGIGNSIISESIEKNYYDLKKITFILAFIISIGSACFLSMYQPFMITWVGKDLLLSFGCVVCFTIRFFVFEIYQILIMYKDAAGIWAKDKYRALFTAMLNLLLDVILVDSLGIFGIVLATLISEVLIAIPWLIFNIFTTIFCNKKYLKEYVFSLLKYLIVAALVSTTVYLLTSSIPDGSLLNLLIKFIVVILLSFFLTLIMMFRDKMFYSSMQLLKSGVLKLKR